MKLTPTFQSKMSKFQTCCHVFQVDQARWCVCDELWIKTQTQSSHRHIISLNWSTWTTKDPLEWKPAVIDRLDWGKKLQNLTFFGSLSTPNDLYLNQNLTKPLKKWWRHLHQGGGTKEIRPLVTYISSSLNWSTWMTKDPLEWEPAVAALTIFKKKIPEIL